MHPAFLPSIPTRPSQARAPAEALKSSRQTTHQLPHEGRVLSARIHMSAPGHDAGAPLQADLDHVALACTGDPEKVLSFYTDTLGFAPCNVDRYRSGSLPFPSARVSATTIIDFFPPALAGPGPGLARASHVCFAVARPAFDALRGRLDKAGVAYTAPAGLRFVAKGDAHTMHFHDPEGNQLEFCYYDEPDAAQTASD